MRAALVGTIVATCAVGAAVPASADVKAGVDAWQQGDYARAIAEWRPMAATGDPDAQFNLGQAYKLGRGVPVDMIVAVQWFRKASAQGHLRASDNLGLLLFQQGQREEAMPLIRKSAERGEPRAQYILGTAMFNGDLAPKDWVRAYALMTRAASSGLEQATTSLAAMDKYIGPAERQKGLALAADMTRESKAPDYAAGSAPPPPVQTAARPPEQAPPPPRQIASAPAPRTPPPPRSDAPASHDNDGPPRRGASYGGASYDSAPKSEAPPPRSPVKPPPHEAPPPAQKPAPKPAHAEAPPPSVAKPPTSGSWRIQMGAFREAPRAKALWQAATSKVSGLSAYKLFLDTAGDVTRVQAGPLRSEADAAQLCGKLRAAGYSCLVKAN
jgi:cell division septation protein DedD